MDRCVTADIARQARKSAQRDAVASGKRFDAVCRAISAALRNIWGQYIVFSPDFTHCPQLSEEKTIYCPQILPAASKALTVAKATLRGLLLAARTPVGAMTRLSMVRNAG